MGTRTCHLSLAPCHSLDCRLLVADCPMLVADCLRRAVIPNRHPTLYMLFVSGCLCLRHADVKDRCLRRPPQEHLAVGRSFFCSGRISQNTSKFFRSSFSPGSRRRFTRQSKCSLTAQTTSLGFTEMEVTCRVSFLIPHSKALLRYGAMITRPTTITSWKSPHRISW